MSHMTINAGDYLRTLESKISEANNENVISSAKVSGLNFIDTQPPKRKTTSSSKERRKRYIKALERAVHSLQTQSTSLSARLNLLQEDTNGLSSKKSELKLRLQSTENEVHMQYAHNDALKKEIQELRAMVHQSIQNEAPTMNTPCSSLEYQKFQSQEKQLHHLQQQKREVEDFDLWSRTPSSSHSDNSSNNSPSKDTTAVFYSDYRLF